MVGAGRVPRVRQRKQVEQRLGPAVSIRAAGMMLPVKQASRRPGGAAGASQIGSRMLIGRLGVHVREKPCRSRAVGIRHAVINIRHCWQRLRHEEEV